jgi:dTDP-4-dehydrorhamnose reductase
MNTLCRVIQAVIENKEKSGIYNIGSEGGISKASFDLMLGKFWNFDCLNMSLIESKNAVFLKANRPNGMVMNSDKFQEVYNYNLPTINETIADIAKEYDVNE